MLFRCLSQPITQNYFYWLFLLKSHCHNSFFYYFCFVENLIKYITYLVARHNCVIIPGTGAFLAGEEPAHYNMKERVFTPPYRTMRFNPNVKADDALLLSEYINDKQLPYDEATAEMNKDIEKLHHNLSKESVVRFSTLGTFYMNIKGEISFEVDANGIEDPANFGFEPFAFPLLRDCEDKKIVIKRRDIGKFVATVAAVILTFIFVTPISDSAFKRGMQASITSFASNEQISMMQQVGTPAPKKVEAIAQECEIAPIDSKGNIIATAPVEPVKEAVIEAPAPVITEHTQEVAMVEKPTKVFHIIVASSPNEDNAKLAIEELSAKKVADYHVVKGGGRHRISIGEYSSNKEAVEALNEIKSTFPDAWVLQTNVR